MPITHTNTKTNKVSYNADPLSFFVAGFQYSEGRNGFDEKGHVVLALEKDNRYDKEALAVYVGSTKVGYVPRPLNSFFVHLLAPEQYHKFKLSDFNAKRLHCEVQITFDD